MNRNITLILSAVLVVVLMAIWLYLVFFADRSSNEPGPIEGSGEFAEFDGLGSDAPAPGSTGGNGQNGSDSSGGDMSDDYNPDILRQLTTRKVVGYTEVDIASTTHVVFMESGVGHIYSINLQTGVEERVSATTIPDAREAAFSPDGQLVVVKTGNHTGYNPLSIGEIDYVEQTVSLSPFTESGGEFLFVDSEEVVFTSQSNTGVIVQSENLETGVSETLFTTPYREAVVILNKNVVGPHYFYPKTDYTLEGFVYEVDGGELSRLDLDGFGFVADLVGDKIIASYRSQSKLVTEMYDVIDEESVSLTSPLIPEKCVVAELNTYCAIPNNTQLKYDSINEWLMGIEMFSDSLWWVDASGNEELVNIKERSGRGVDVINGMIGDLSSDWYFQNKADGSLWIYELSQVNSREVTEEENI